MIHIDLMTIDKHADKYFDKHIDKHIDHDNWPWQLTIDKHIVQCTNPTSSYHCLPPLASRQSGGRW